MYYMDKMMLIKLYNEWIANIRKETGIIIKRDFESFLTFLDERGLLKKQPECRFSQTTSDIINAAEAKMEAEKKGKKNE